MKFSGVVFALMAMECVSGFAFAPSLHVGAFQSPTRTIFPIHMSDNGVGDSEVPKSSRLEGNARGPTEAEQTVMNEMVMKLADAKAYDLPNAVKRAFRVVSSPAFFMTIAALTDKAEDEVTKEKLTALASNLVSTIDAVVSTAEDQLDERAQYIEEVVKAAAEPDSGEFLVPLSIDRVNAMREIITKLEPSMLDESFLSTIDAYMNKSHEDGMDGMVGILQKVLQMYAGLAVSRARAAQDIGGDAPAAKLFEKLMAVDTDVWDMELRQGLKNDQGVTSTALVGEAQRTIESVVLGLESGCMAQRVQAEFLRELVSRLEAYQQKE